MPYVQLADLERALRQDGKPHVLECSRSYEFRLITAAIQGENAQQSPLDEALLREYSLNRKCGLSSKN